jgi:UDP-glucuronate 4-epimerase
VSLGEAIATLGEVVGVEPRLDVQPVEAGDVRDTLADVSRAAEWMGYRPTTKLAGGLARQCEWLRCS